MIERPLDRLNYYNGQRLEGSDLKLEQEYHIRTRRWLNKSLYKPGIASGLDIRPEKDPKNPAGNTRNVIVSPGLALDSEGREILLLEEEHVFVPGKPHKMGSGSDAEVEGLYLTIRYDEKSIEEERNGCIPGSAKGKKNGDRAAWGGPALIRAKPLFNWRDALPYESSGEIVLGEVELTSDCAKVDQIDTGVRRYVGAASAAKVRQYALEGEREIAFIPKEEFPVPNKGEPARQDVKIVGRIYFHIRGRQPGAVVLYLRADAISLLHYTELPYHRHDGSASGGTDYADEALNTAKTVHKHSVTSKELDGGGHPHGMLAWTERHGSRKQKDNLIFQLGFADAVHKAGGDAQRDDVLDLTHGIISGSGEHKHTIAAYETVEKGFQEAYQHKHAFSGASLSIANQGVVDSFNVGRTGDILTFVDNLQVLVGPVQYGSSIKDRTKDIQQQLADTNSPNWKDGTGSPRVLGDGKDNHVFVSSGTGPIRLDFLPGMTFTEGEYCIELKVEAKTDSAGKNVANGGKILYNLYVE